MISLISCLSVRVGHTVAHSYYLCCPVHVSPLSLPFLCSFPKLLFRSPITMTTLMSRSVALTNVYLKLFVEFVLLESVALFVRRRRHLNNCCFLETRVKSCPYCAAAYCCPLDQALLCLLAHHHYHCSPLYTFFSAPACHHPSPQWRI